MAKQSGWVIAATEGTTIDGRAISKAWIEEMAETYSVTEYVALIWPEHYRSEWTQYEGKNWGTVDEVKAEKRGGKYRLLVKITANDYLLAANKDGQKLFMSIEIDPDFTGSAKCYLKGLAVTDSPASTGTTRLKFSAGQTEIEREYSHLEELNYSDFTPNNSQTTEQQATSLLNQLINLFKHNQAVEAPSANIAEDDNTMTPEQQAKFEKQFAEVTEQLTGVAAKFNELDKKLDEKFSAPGKEEAAPAEEPAPVETITLEKFNELSEKLTSMETKFAEMSKETAGQEPEPAGGESAFTVV